MGEILSSVGYGKHPIMWNSYSDYFMSIVLATILGKINLCCLVKGNQQVKIGGGYVSSV